MREHASFSRRALAALPIAALVGAAPVAVAAAPAGPSDVAFARIAEHRTLRIAIGATSGRDDDPAYVTACEVEEAALQALGDVPPTTVAGAAALLAYMAEVEGDFADPLSPLMRTVRMVAHSLGELSARAAS